mmetsp:Transcript_131328/g.366118  ORF Transcript_131328/g.366118 Transcript_131328/m.366118 type:complete len:223 (-) Transcript_131328:354-1022(-)
MPTATCNGMASWSTASCSRSQLRRCMWRASRRAPGTWSPSSRRSRCASAAGLAIRTCSSSATAGRSQPRTTTRAATIPSASRRPSSVSLSATPWRRCAARCRRAPTERRRAWAPGATASGASRPGTHWPGGPGPSASHTSARRPWTSTAVRRWPPWRISAGRPAALRRCTSTAALSRTRRRAGRPGCSSTGCSGRVSWTGATSSTRRQPLARTSTARFCGAR